MLAPPGECNLNHKGNNFKLARCIEKVLECDNLLIKHYLQDKRENYQNCSLLCMTVVHNGMHTDISTC